MGNGYDCHGSGLMVFVLYGDWSSVKRKLVAQALRFVAHFNGAGLVFTSVKEKTLRDQVGRQGLVNE